MNWKTIAIVAITALLGISIWHLTQDRKNPDGFAKLITGICQEDITIEPIDTTEAQSRIKTYQAYIEGLSLAHQDSINTSILLGLQAFRWRDPCEFKSILKNAVYKDSIYAIIGMSINKDTLKPHINLMFQIQTGKKSTDSSKIDSRGYSYYDHGCNCKTDPSCCPCLCCVIICDD